MSFKRFVLSLKTILINNFKLLRFRKIGKHVFLGGGLLINGPFKQDIRLGNDVYIGRFARFGNTLGKTISIGNGCTIGNNFTAMGGEIVIEDNVLIASSVCILASNHCMVPGLYASHEMNTKPVHIGKQCWIGEKTIVLPGCSIGEKTIIGAGSVVTKPIPSYTIAVGNPAKIIKQWDIQNNRWKSIQ